MIQLDPHTRGCCSIFEHIKGITFEIEVDNLTIVRRTIEALSKMLNGQVMKLVAKNEDLSGVTFAIPLELHSDASPSNITTHYYKGD